MPSTSIAQQHLMGLAEHHPEQVNAANRGVLKMNHNQLHDFAATKHTGLPKHAATKPSAHKPSVHKPGVRKPRKKKKAHFPGPGLSKLGGY